MPEKNLFDLPSLPSLPDLSLPKWPDPSDSTPSATPSHDERTRYGRLLYELDAPSRNLGDHEKHQLRQLLHTLYVANRAPTPEEARTLEPLDRPPPARATSPKPQPKRARRSPNEKPEVVEAPQFWWLR